MPRPEKTTVDYFSHDVKGGQTLFILESKFGNDGYAFWFKLLEIIGGCEGHSFDCGNPVNWEFLIAKTNVNEETAEMIMKSLMKLGAIDADLWREHHIVWIQKFVDRLSGLYDKRTVKPKKPSFSNENSKIDEFPERKPEETEESAPETHQSKVKKSKEEEVRMRARAKDSDDPRFAEFWMLYPNKKAKQNALKAWKKLKPSDELFQTILDAIRDQAKSAQWLRDDGQYIPHAATWLNNKRWEDSEQDVSHGESNGFDAEEDDTF